MFSLLLSTAAAKSLSEDVYRTQFTKWMVEFDKEYDAEEFWIRYETFKDNYDFITQHNDRFQAGKESYRVALNGFADMNRGEFKRVMLGLEFPAGYKPQRLEDLTMSSLRLDGALNWTALGAVTPVKNQGQCGSCWAFSTTGSMEGAIQIASGQLTSLSEQQLVDCAGSYGNFGCNGGLMDNAFNYAAKNGLCAESAYPYTGKNGVCQASSCTAQPGTYLSGYTDVTGGEDGSSNSLSTDIGQQPISIAIEADQAGFQFYSGGVFTGPCGQNLDHGVLLTGYGTDPSSNLDYWSVKNSWGSSWGENGYIRLVRDQDLCGLGNEPSYPAAGSN